MNPLGRNGGVTGVLEIEPSWILEYLQKHEEDLGKRSKHKIHIYRPISTYKPGDNIFSNFVQETKFSGVQFSSYGISGNTQKCFGSWSGFWILEL